MVAVSEPAPGRGVLPAWPLLVMLAGFPLTWPLGLTALAPPVLAAVMVVLLARRGTCRLLPGVAPLLLFVAWTVPCGLMVDSGARLAGWGLRQLTLAAVAIVVVYITNAPERVTRARVVGALTVVWATVVVGGWLGVLAPNLTFTTPMGLLVPSGLLDNDLVHHMFVPTMAEVQTPWGAPGPFNRPAAPFLYANGWGAAFVLLTPVTVATLVTTRNAWVRWSVALLLLASVVPAVASSNRGMFLGLAASTAYVAVRLVARARARTLLLFAVGAAVVTTLAVRLDVLARISDRQEYSTSTEGRISLYAETWHRTLESPFFGWGAPRPSLEHEVSVGTQGYVWAVMFSYGLVGLLLFAFFLVGAVLRTWRVVDDTAILLHASLVGAVVIVLFYGLDVMQWLTIGSLAALLLRESAVRPVAALRPRARAPVVTVS